MCDKVGPTSPPDVSSSSAFRPSPSPLLYQQSRQFIATPRALIASSIENNQSLTDASEQNRQDGAMAGRPRAGLRLRPIGPPKQRHAVSTDDTSSLCPRYTSGYQTPCTFKFTFTFTPDTFWPAHLAHVPASPTSSPSFLISSSSNHHCPVLPCLVCSPACHRPGKPTSRAVHHVSPSPSVALLSLAMPLAPHAVAMACSTATSLPLATPRPPVI